MVIENGQFALLPLKKSYTYMQFNKFIMRSYITFFITIRQIEEEMLEKFQTKNKYNTQFV